MEPLHSNQYLVFIIQMCFNDIIDITITTTAVTFTTSSNNNITSTSYHKLRTLTLSQFFSRKLIDDQQISVRPTSHNVLREIHHNVY